MKPAASIYDSPRIAEGYAFGRPPVHQAIVQRIARDLGIASPVARALDVGCGAGLSTAALDPIAAEVVGLDPMPQMLKHRRKVFPGGRFVIGRAEELPFVDRSFDLVTAAGSINYAETDPFLQHVRRLIRPGGTLVVYDFSDGKRFHDDPRLQDWYDTFEQRYPSQPGYALDVRTLRFAAAGLHLDRYQAFDVAVPMSLESYTRYAMSQTSVALAMTRGTPEAEIDRWCRATLAGVFDETRDVVFDAYTAYVTACRDDHRDPSRPAV